MNSSIEEGNTHNKYTNKGITGLANIGNTCYINSCMQIISHTYELNDFLETGSYKKRINKIADSVVLVEWDKLREMMWSSNCTIAPWGFVKGIQKVALLKDRELFTGNAQNDVQEYLLFIIDCFHNSIRREVEMEITGDVINKTDKLAKVCYEMMRDMYKKDYSEILNIFYGIHVSQISSLDKNECLSLRPEPFSVLSLSIAQVRNPTIFDCLDLYCKKETLEGENAWFNEDLNRHQNVSRGIIFWSLPNILIIDLKRWSYDGRKNGVSVSVELSNIDFSDYVKGYNSCSYIYDLYGVANHSGGSAGGHYTASIKNANGKWYEFNDTFVKEINGNNIVSSKSYCFFFRKKK
jgi:ubiquitin carboxyl-terminal hydrolase 8